jgi:hypothetical protein
MTIGMGTGISITWRAVTRRGRTVITAAMLQIWRLRERTSNRKTGLVSARNIKIASGTLSDLFKNAIEKQVTIHPLALMCPIFKTLNTLQHCGPQIMKFCIKRMLAKQNVDRYNRTMRQTFGIYVNMEKPDRANLGNEHRQTKGLIYDHSEPLEGGIERTVTNEMNTVLFRRVPLCRADFFYSYERQ